MASNSEKICEGSGDSPAPPVPKQPQETEPKSERTKATRHPRWTRQETLVLIDAKKLVESGEQVSRYKSPPGFVVQTDPKWDLVSSFCQQQGVKRGAVQCRKRWGNLLTDFRKINKWETNIKDEAESFWMMRNDKRKEKKLPGFFDAVVYNVLDGGVCTAAAYPLALIKGAPKPAENNNGDQVVEGGGVCKDHHQDHEDDDDLEEDETIVDSEMGWSTEEENNTETTNTITGNKVNSPMLKTPATPKETVMMIGNARRTPLLKLPSSEQQQPPSCRGNHNPGFQREHMSQEGHKRRRLSADNCEDTTSFNSNIVKVLRRNSNMLKAHLGAQNINYQLAREQQKEQTDSLVAALGKLTDALTKIADKL